MKDAGAAWSIAALEGKAHDRSTFSCGSPELDHYIQRLASQDVKRNVARVFVALENEKPNVRGYYTLSAASFQRDGLPLDHARRLPRYPVPAALLGRLAVDSNAKGKGLGAFLLMDALNRVFVATQTLAIYAFVVDAKDAAAAAFYHKYGFIALDEGQRRLFLPMTTIRALIGE